MLNWEQIAQRVENPSISSGEDIQDLKLLCDKFPYSQVFPMLYLKALAQNKHILFEEELEKYAFRITNRAQLYELIHFEFGEISNLGVEDKLEILEEDLEVTKIPEIVDELTESATVELESYEKIELDIEQEVGIIETLVSSDENSQVEVIEEEFQDEKVVSIEELEKDILASSFSLSYKLEDSENEVDTISEIDLTELEIELTLHEKLQEEEVQLKKFDIHKARTFNDWLKLSDSDYSIEQDNLEEEKEETNPEITYIEFEKPKREFFSPAKKAKESLDESNLPVSETLARIFEIQGNIPKSIYVYEQLSLIIPEKKTYFASQIKKLRKKLN
jgi:hypothetical protein